MNQELIKKIDELIDADRANIAADVIKLVNIRSVREEPLPGAPFGAGPRKVLDTVLEMGAERGLETFFYDKAAVASVALKPGEIDLGVWAHGDVVHEGIGWNFDPYNAVEYKGCIIGRGATDNKGQLVAILRLLEIFKKLGVELKYNPALYIGSNEESGMGDMIGVPGNEDAQGFINVYKCPKLSLVPDGGFPVGYGGKGAVRANIRAKTPWEGIKMIAGQTAAPGLAEVWFKTLKDCPDMEGCTVERGEVLKVTAESAPIHTSSPKAEGNMVTMITKALLDNNLLSENDAKKAEFLNMASLDIAGEKFGVAAGGGKTGKLTFALVSVTDVDGKPEFGVNIRYPIETTFEKVTEQLSAFAEENGFELVAANRGVSAYILDPEWDVIKVLNQVANDVTGEDKAPYTLGGGTYAHRLPNALVYGMNGNRPPEDFPKGHGGAHGKDECVSLDRLQRAMRIYARAFLALNEMEW